MKERDLMRLKLSGPLRHLEFIFLIQLGLVLGSDPCYLDNRP